MAAGLRARQDYLTSGKQSRFLFREEDIGTRSLEKMRLDRQMDEEMMGWSDTRRQGWRWGGESEKQRNGRMSDADGDLQTSRWI